MPTNLNDKMEDFNRNMMDATNELVQLNLKTMSNITSTVQKEFLSELRDVKNPQDLLSLQLKIATKCNTELLESMTKAYEIIFRSITNFSNLSGAMQFPMQHSSHKK